MVLYTLLIYHLIFTKLILKNKRICKNFGIEKLKELNMLKKDFNLEMNNLRVKEWKEIKKN